MLNESLTFTFKREWRLTLNSGKYIDTCGHQTLRIGRQGHSPWPQGFTVGGLGGKTPGTRKYDKFSDVKSLQRRNSSYSWSVSTHVCECVWGVCGCGKVWVGIPGYENMWVGMHVWLCVRKCVHTLCMYVLSVQGHSWGQENICVWEGGGRNTHAGSHVGVCVFKWMCACLCVCLWLNGSVSTAFLKEEQIILTMCCWVTNDEMWWLQTAILDLSHRFCGSEIRA